MMDKFHEQRAMFADKIPLDEAVDFICDKQAEKNAILKTCDEYIDLRDDNIRPYYGAAPRFEDDQDFLPLQAADLWAWWVREWWEEEAYERGPQRQRDYDFGSWRGKRRKQIIMSFNEDHMVDAFKQFAMDSLVRKQEDPRF
jgi:hypothetical protein